VALALAACTAPGAPASPVRSSAGTGQPATAATAGLARCASAALRISAGRQGENLGAHGDIEFTNTGFRPCRLLGLPTVTIVRAGGTSLPVQLVRAAGVQLRPLVLPPGRPGAADLVVFWANWCGPGPGPLRVRVMLPAGGTVTGPFDGPPDYDYVPRCVNPRLPSTISVLDAYEPGPDGQG
jgi:hypothetical protein